MPKLYNETVMVLLGNISCFVALIFACISFFCKNRLHFLLSQVTCHIFYIAGYCFLGAWTGVAVIAISSCFMIIFYVMESYNQKPNLWLMLLIDAIIIVCTIFTWDGAWSLLLTVANMIFMFGVWYGKRDVFLVCQILTSIFAIVYNVIYMAYTGVALEGMALVVACIALINLFHENKNKLSNKNIKNNKNGNKIIKK